jgi:nucleoside-diphosphate kinase
MSMSDDRQKTLVILKPDFVSDFLEEALAFRTSLPPGLYGNLDRYRVTRLDAKDAEELYEEHKGKPFYEELVRFMTSGSCIVMEVEGRDAVRRVRGEVLSAIRAKYATPGGPRNAIHASDSVTAAQRELAYFFGETLWQRRARLAPTSG